MEFDEQEAIKYMRSQFPQEWRARYDDDQLLNVIDIIWDYYEDSGMLDIGAALDGDDTDVSVDEIVAHVTKLLRKDKGSEIATEHIAAIVNAELAYEESIGLGE
jgi:hypothetical protein